MVNTFVQSNKDGEREMNNCLHIWKDKGDQSHVNLFLGQARRCIKCGLAQHNGSGEWETITKEEYDAYWADKRMIEGLRVFA